MRTLNELVATIILLSCNTMVESQSGLRDEGSGVPLMTSPGCVAKTDVVMVIQGLNSVEEGNFGLLRNCLAQIVSNLALENSFGFCVAVVVYGTESYLEIPFTCSQDAAIGQVELLRNPQGDGKSLGNALLLMRELFAESSRENTIARVGVIVASTPSTDGLEVSRQITLARQDGIQLIPVTIGGNSSSIFPSTNFRSLLSFPSYTDFNENPTALQNEICDKPRYCSSFSPRIVANPRDCTSYLACTYFPEPFPSYRIVSCPTGLFFNPAKGSCDYPPYVRCLTDLCFDIASGTVQDENSCSMFWRCEDGRTVGNGCCGSGKSYSEGEGCVDDNSCTDTCSPVSSHMIPLPAASDCDRMPLNGLSDWYMEAGQFFSCEIGHVFEPSLCECTKQDGGRTTSDGNECHPELLLGFSGESITNEATGPIVPWVNPGVIPQQGFILGALDGHVAIFTGQEEGISVPFYANTIWGSKIQLTLRFREYGDDVASGVPQGLFSNSKCPTVFPSMELYLDEVSRKIVAFISTDTSFGMVTVPYTPGEWKNLTLQYDGDNSSFSLDLNGQSTTSSVSVSGDVRSVNCAITFGMIPRMEKFRGEVDMVSLFRGCLPSGSLTGKNRNPSPTQQRAIFICGGKPGRTRKTTGPGEYRIPEQYIPNPQTGCHNAGQTNNICQWFL